jgi:hypothetical protein
MGVVFAFASGTTDITTAHPESVATGMLITFTTAVILLVVALVTVLESRVLLQRTVSPNRNQADVRDLISFGTKA